MRRTSRTGALAAVFTVLAAPATLAGDAIPWTRDQALAFAQAGERREPVMILFIGPQCGGKALPGDMARGGAHPQVDFKDNCELMEEDVLSRPEVAAAAVRFVALLSDEGLLPGAKKDPQERNLNRRYQVATIPTVLFADPWGNEIIRLVGYAPKDKFLHVLKAIPADFSALEKAGRLLREDGENASALVAAASFYEGHGLLPVSERLYEKALGTRELESDTAARRQVAIARGMALLRMNKTAEAAELFGNTLDEAPEGPLADALLFGRMLAELQGGRMTQARAVYADLQKRFPASAYAAKARERLEPAATPKP